MYESDNSLTATVNKSLDLGQSLVDHCANIRFVFVLYKKYLIVM